MPVVARGMPWYFPRAHRGQNDPNRVPSVITSTRASSGAPMVMMAMLP
jgi:hypothetical protein